MKKSLKIILAVAAVAASLSVISCGGKSKAITVAIPNDTTNEARALLLLQEGGYITLKDGAGITTWARTQKFNVRPVKN